MKLLSLQPEVVNAQASVLQVTAVQQVPAIEPVQQELVTAERQKVTVTLTVQVLVATLLRVPLSAWRQA